jgi:hypothetical protein
MTLCASHGSHPWLDLIIQFLFVVSHVPSLTPLVLRDYTKRPFTKSVKKSILTATSFLGKSVHEACVTCGVTRAPSDGDVLVCPNLRLGN